MRGPESQRVPAAAWARLMDELERDCELVVEQQYRRVRSELPTYATLSMDEFRTAARQNVEFLIGVLREQREPGPAEDLSRYEALGESRARQGIADTDLMHAWRIRHEVLHDWIYAHIDAGDQESLALLARALDLALRWVHLGIVATAAAHARCSRAIASQESRRRTELVRRLLFGGATHADFLGSSAVGVDADGSYLAVHARPQSELELPVVEQFLRGGAPHRARNGLVAEIDGDICGFVVKMPLGDAPCPIGFSSPTALADLPGGFRLATRALDVAIALGRRGAFSLRDVPVHAAVLTDRDVNQALHERFIEPVLTLGRTGEAILDTVAAYLERDRHTVSTARDLYLHANTVRYRINRFEELTSCSLLRTESLVSVWWALQHRVLSSRTRPG